MNPLSGVLGLAARAGKVRAGEHIVLARLKKGGVHLIVMDASTAKNTRMRMEGAGRRHNVEIVYLPEGILGQSIGKPASKVAAVEDLGFAGRVLALVNAQNE